MERNESVEPEYDRILRAIRDQLTGDRESDIAILKEQMDRYKDHPLAPEIIKACARMLYDSMPDDAKNVLEELLEKENASLRAQLQKIRKLYSEKKIEEAVTLAEELAQRADGNPMFREDAVSRFFNFHEWMEELAYQRIAEEEKQIRIAQFPYDEIYTLLGSLYVEQKALDKARNALAKALVWNPVDADAAFEYAETFKPEGSMEAFLNETRRISQFAFRTRHVAHILRNLGYYCFEIREYRDALACYMYSLLFDKDSPMAVSEIRGICAHTGMEPAYPDPARCRELAEKYQISFGPDMDLLQMIYSTGMYCRKENRKDDANYCFRILYELTDDEEIRALIKETSKSADDLECRIEAARPMPQEQFEKLLLLVKKLNQDRESVLLNFSSCLDDSLQSVWISRAEHGFNMILSFDMSEFAWEKPLQLGAMEIPAGIALDILQKLASEGVSTGDISYIQDHFADLGE